MYQTRILIDLVSEPVSLAEVKEFMEIDFADFDALITSLIKSARISSEQFTGLSYGEKTIELTSKCTTSVQLPLGPVINITSVKNSNGDDLEYDVFGFDNPIVSIKTNSTGLLNVNGATDSVFNVIYQAGYATCPEDLKNAIKQRVETAFQYRSDATNENMNEAVNKSVLTEFAYRVNPMF